MIKYKNWIYAIVIGSWMLMLWGCEGESKHQVPYGRHVIEFNEITIEGCQYIKGYRVMSHKGNCTNPIHAN